MCQCYCNMLFMSALCGYILGSIPFGLVLTRLAGYGDIRKIGSGNIGATNVLRTGNKTLALLTVLLDAFKAGIAAYLAYIIAPNVSYDFFGIDARFDVVCGLLSGSMGVIGHNFPIWLDFKGGKGVASAFGLILIMSWPLALIALFIWLFMAFTFRYSSLAALTAAACVPFLALLMLPAEYCVFYFGIVILVIARHKDNIKRLLNGQESKIHLKKQA